jgi:microcystin-dependent protein
VTDSVDPGSTSEEFTRTRRWLFQAGAGAALGLVGGRAAWLEQSASAATAARGAGEEIHVGEIRLFAGDYVPKGWLGCDGQELAIQDHGELARAIGDTFGGNGQTHFRVPDLRGRALVGEGQSPGEAARKVGESGRALAVRDPDVLPLTLALNYLINPESRSGSALFAEVRPFAFGFVPRDWEICDGRVLRISQHNILFAVIGPRFGGDARDTFALPDLRSYTPLNHGDGPGLTPAPMASHRQNLAPGGPSRRPRLHVNYCIATQGEFPSMR